MNRREHESRERRPAKRSRSPDERDRSPREDKRRRPPEREREHSPRATRHSSRLNNGRPREDEERRERDDRRERADRREWDSRSRGRRGNSPPVSWRSLSSNRQDEQSRYERENRPVNSSKPDEKPRSERKPPPLPPSTEPSEAGKKKVITASALLEDELDESESLAKVLGFSRFSTTKGKKHVDYGGVQLIKSREYRQYMNRPGGFNKPIDQA